MQTEIRTPPEYSDNRGGLNKRIRDITRGVEDKLENLFDEVAANAYDEGIREGCVIGRMGTEAALKKEFRELGTYEILIRQLEDAYEAGYRKGHEDARAEISAATGE